ncbi:MAG TPA: hypothetical protein VHP58_03180 [Alphaproteobacteria bacterium]|nr:hypothetical protein [Alphaproteobacteria bacterium]
MAPVILTIQRAAQITSNILNSRRKKLRHGLWRGELYFSQAYFRFDHAAYVCKFLTTQGERPVLSYDPGSDPPYLLAVPLRHEDDIQPPYGARWLNAGAYSEFFTGGIFRQLDAGLNEPGNDYAR